MLALNSNQNPLAGIQQNNVQQNDITINHDYANVNGKMTVKQLTMVITPWKGQFELADKLLKQKESMIDSINTSIIQLNNSYDNYTKLHDDVFSDVKHSFLETEKLLKQSKDFLKNQEERIKRYNQAKRLVDLIKNDSSPDKPKAWLNALQVPNHLLVHLAKDLLFQVKSIGKQVDDLENNANALVSTSDSNDFSVVNALLDMHHDSIVAQSTKIASLVARAEHFQRSLSKPVDIEPYVKSFFPSKTESIVQTPKRGTNQIREMIENFKRFNKALTEGGSDRPLHLYNLLPSFMLAQQQQPALFGHYGSTAQQPSLFGQSTQPQQTSLFAQATTGTQQATTNLFGQSTAQTGTGGLFGTTTTQPSTGLFGSTATQPTTTGTGLFGSTTSTTQPGSTSLFGSTTTTQPQQTSLFGQQQTTTQPSTTGTGLFGQTSSTLQASTPSFGQSSTTGTGLFGQSTAQTGTGGLFGTTTTQPSTGLFGQPTQPQQTSLFGSTAQQPSLFGQPSTNQPSLFGQSTQPQQTSLFGQQQTTTQPSLFGQTTPQTGTGSLFGQSSTTGTGLFGSTTTQPTTTGTGLFGSSTTTPIFGQSTSTGLFGQPTQPQQTSLFGSTAQQPSLFGQSTQPQQTTLFGQATQSQQPSLFGQPATTQPTTGVFGTNQPQQTTLFGQNTQQAGAGGLFTSASQLQQNTGMLNRNVLGSTGTFAVNSTGTAVQIGNQQQAWGQQSNLFNRPQQTGGLFR